MRYNSILVRAIAVITEMCRLLSGRSRETWAEAWGNGLIKLMDMATEKVALRINDREKIIQRHIPER